MGSVDPAGLAAGFLTAILSASSFLASSWALKRTQGLTSPGLMMHAGLVMGLISLALLFPCGGIALFQNGVAGRLPIMLGAAAFFFLGQTSVFGAQKLVEPSRVVPLLGLKLPMLAFITVCFLGDSFSWTKAGAILLAVVAAFLLNNAGRHFPVASVVLVLAGCLFYCLSDLCLTALTNRLAADLHESQSLAALHCTILTYLTVGILALLSFGASPKTFGKTALVHSIPFSVFWLACIVTLNFCFARLGTLHGVLLQNTRGIFTLLLTPICIALGCTALENKLTGTLFAKRMAAAILVFLSVLLYQLG